MAELVIVRRGTYHDSARLMRIARELGSLPGIASADVMMGTAANVELLADAGFSRKELGAATPMDMVVALRSRTDQALAAAQESLATLLSGASAGAKAAGPQQRPRSVEEAVRLHPAANLVSIAVPGIYAAFVARRALDTGRNVFLFSDNVALADEVALKALGRERGLLVMGPDCGTAIVAGVGLGFANRVPRGPVGIVGASGTGTQEVCCLLARMGVGVSHAIGTGSRDLSAAVGGVMTELALSLLGDDPGTDVVVLIAKHPAPEVAHRLHGVLARTGKPAVVRYLGEPGRPAADGVVYAGSLDEAAAAAATASGLKLRVAREDGEGTLDSRFATLDRAGGRLVGLFGGGSLAAEAQHLLRSSGVDTAVPDRPLRPDQPLPRTGNLIVDTGDDAYTVGRPHPMVDQTVRCGLVRTAGADPTVGLILLDLVLGDGAHPDPAPEIVAAVADARQARGGTPLAVVCSLCGSRDDPQDTGRQEAVLRAAGIHVAFSAARAAGAAATLLGRVAERNP